MHLESTKGAATENEVIESKEILYTPRNTVLYIGSTILDLWISDIQKNPDESDNTRQEMSYADAYYGFLGSLMVEALDLKTSEGKLIYQKSSKAEITQTIQEMIGLYCMSVKKNITGTPEEKIQQYYMSLRDEYRQGTESTKRSLIFSIVSTYHHYRETSQQKFEKGSEKLKAALSLNLTRNQEKGKDDMSSLAHIPSPTIPGLSDSIGFLLDAGIIPHNIRFLTARDHLTSKISPIIHGNYTHKMANTLDILGQFFTSKTSKSFFITELQAGINRRTKGYSFFPEKSPTNEKKQHIAAQFLEDMLKKHYTHKPSLHHVMQHLPRDASFSRASLSALQDKYGKKLTPEINDVEWFEDLLTICSSIYFSQKKHEVVLSTCLPPHGVDQIIQSAPEAYRPIISTFFKKRDTDKPSTYFLLEQAVCSAHATKNSTSKTVSYTLNIGSSSYCPAASLIIIYNEQTGQISYIEGDDRVFSAIKKRVRAEIKRYGGIALLLQHHNTLRKKLFVNLTPEQAHLLEDYIVHYIAEYLMMSFSDGDGDKTTRTIEKLFAKLGASFDLPASITARGNHNHLMRPDEASYHHELPSLDLTNKEKMHGLRGELLSDKSDVSNLHHLFYTYIGRFEDVGKLTPLTYGPHNTSYMEAIFAGEVYQNTILQLPPAQRDQEYDFIRKNFNSILDHVRAEITVNRILHTIRSSEFDTLPTNSKEKRKSQDVRHIPDFMSYTDDIAAYMHIPLQHLEKIENNAYNHILTTPRTRQPHRNLISSHYNIEKDFVNDLIIHTQTWIGSILENSPNILSSILANKHLQDPLSYIENALQNALQDITPDSPINDKHEKKALLHSILGYIKQLGDLPSMQERNDTMIKILWYFTHHKDLIISCILRSKKQELLSIMKRKESPQINMLCGENVSTEELAAHDEDLHAQEATQYGQKSARQRKNPTPEKLSDMQYKKIAHFSESLYKSIEKETELLYQDGVDRDIAVIAEKELGNIIKSKDLQALYTTEGLSIYVKTLQDVIANYITEKKELHHKKRQERYKNSKAGIERTTLGHFPMGCMTTGLFKQEWQKLVEYCRIHGQHIVETYEDIEKQEAFLAPQINAFLASLTQHAELKKAGLIKKMGKRYKDTPPITITPLSEASDISRRIFQACSSLFPTTKTYNPPSADVIAKVIKNCLPLYQQLTTIEEIQGVFELCKSALIGEKRASFTAGLYTNTPSVHDPDDKKQMALFLEKTQRVYDDLITYTKSDEVGKKTRNTKLQSLLDNGKIVQTGCRTIQEHTIIQSIYSITDFVDAGEKNLDDIRGEITLIANDDGIKTGVERLLTAWQVAQKDEQKSRDAIQKHMTLKQQHIEGLSKENALYKQCCDMLSRISNPQYKIAFGNVIRNFHADDMTYHGYAEDRIILRGIDSFIREKLNSYKTYKEENSKIRKKIEKLGSATQLHADQKKKDAIMKNAEKEYNIVNSLQQYISTLQNPCQLLSYIRKYRDMLPHITSTDTPQNDDNLKENLEQALGYFSRAYHIVKFFQDIDSHTPGGDVDEKVFKHMLTMAHKTGSLYALLGYCYDAEKREALKDIVLYIQENDLISDARKALQAHEKPFGHDTYRSKRLLENGLFSLMRMLHTTVTRDKNRKNGFLISDLFETKEIEHIHNIYIHLASLYNTLEHNTHIAAMTKKLLGEKTL